MAPKLNKTTGIALAEVLISLFLLAHAYKALK